MSACKNKTRNREKCIALCSECSCSSVFVPMCQILTLPSSPALTQRILSPPSLHKARPTTRSWCASKWPVIRGGCSRISSMNIEFLAPKHKMPRSSQSLTRLQYQLGDDGKMWSAIAELIYEHRHIKQHYNRKRHGYASRR